MILEKGFSIIPTEVYQDGQSIGDVTYINEIFERFTADIAARSEEGIRNGLREMFIGAATGGLGRSLSLGRTFTGLPDATRKGAKFNSLAIKLTPRQFQNNLAANGYRVIQQGVSKNGPFTVLTKGDKTYTIYTATSGGPSAQVKVAGKTVSIVRLGR
jgi:hypothetical protein